MYLLNMKISASVRHEDYVALNQTQEHLIHETTIPINNNLQCI